MDADRGIELGFGGAAVKRYRKALDDLPRVRSDHMTAEHPIGDLVDDQFHHRALVTSRERVSKGLKRGLVDIDLEICLACLSLGQPHRGAIGRAEDRRGDIEVCGPGRLIIE